MKKTLLLTLLFALIATLGFSQTDKAWSANTESRSSIIPDKGVARLAYPKVFRLFNLNIDPLRNELFSIVDAAAKRSAIISLPNADGSIEQFEVWEASNFVPELQAAYPQIRAYSGRGITDKYATLKLSISPQGISTMVFRVEKENEFMEPYSSDHTVYSVYKSQREKGKLSWVCSTVDTQLATDLNAKVYGTNSPTNSDGILRTARLAQSCNGEYANFFGATPANHDTSLVYAAFNTTLTRCNGCYEKDLALHLNLIGNLYEDQIIFFDPVTDPYTTLGAWNGQLQTLLNNVVGDINYDIGHMFGGSGGGGNAGCIGCICVAGQKGSGITSPADGIPMGDNFDIDYVVHEVGHQLGGNHSFTFSNEGTVAQKEVGAGITIMGYAGITSYDPAPHSIDIYTAANIAQIQTNLAGKACPTTLTMTANHPPVVAPVSNYTIPMQTPFALTGSATDPEGDPITYCWEQNDVGNAYTGANSVAFAGKTGGPNFLTFPATVSPTRFFPKLSTILAGLQLTPPLPGGDAICNIEALSNVSRTETFRLTVRDNNPYVPGVKIGQTAFTDMTLTVTNTSGPFQVTSPNTNVIWPANSSQTITWDVNNTNSAPVSCANVKISLSTDGGNTFPTVLAASTPNDGTEVLTIPNTLTTTARIKVEAIGNIFFDISNTDFTIASPAGGYNFTAPSPASVTCGTAASADITLTTVSNGGYIIPINLTATGNPAGTTVSYSVNPVIPGNNTVVTLNAVNTLIPGNYPIKIKGISGTITDSVILTYTVAPGAGPAIGTQPVAKQVCVGLNTSFTVLSATATGYQWQVSTNGGVSWNNIINAAPYSGATSATLTITGSPITFTSYQYRVIVSGQCGSTTSNIAIITVSPLPTVTAISSAASICTGTPVTLTAGGADTYTWSTGTTPATGAIVTATPVVTTTYTATGTTTATGCINTASVTVIATPKPTVTLTAAPFTRLLPNLTTTLTATGSSPSTNNFAYLWTYSGGVGLFPGNTHVVNLAGMGTYTVTAADASNLACVSLPASITIADSASSKLFIYPSPNNGHFTVSYYNPGGGTTQQGITVYDSHGARVYNNVFFVSQPYQLHQVDLRRNAAGVYYVVLRDANGKKIKTGEVIVR